MPDPLSGRPLPDYARRPRTPAEVELVPPDEMPLVPAALLATDRLVIAPRIRVPEPLVYVACHRRTGEALYTGKAHDLDARRLRHEREVMRGDPGSQSGSVLAPGMTPILSAVWAAIPVPAPFAGDVEAALRVILAPAYLPLAGRGVARKLGSRHRAGLLAAGFDPAAVAVWMETYGFR